MSDFITIANKTYTFNAVTNRTAVQFDLCFAAAQIGGSKISGAVIDLVYPNINPNIVVSSSVTSPDFTYTDENGDQITGVKVWSNTINNLSGASATGGIALTVDPTLINYDPIIIDGKVLTVKLYVSGNVTDFPVSLQSDASGGDNYITTADAVKHDLDGGYLANTISGIALSADTGTSATDFNTNIADQTITGTLSITLGTNDKLYGSLDNGSNWTDITGKVNGTSISWTNATLAGSSAIKFEIRDASSGNVVGSAGSHAYVLDTVAPATTISTLVFSADTGTSSTDFITKTAAQTISGTLSAVTVAGEVVKVSTDNGATWTTATNTIGQDSFSLSGVTLTGNNTLKVQVEDAAGNAGTATSHAYVFDTTAPGVSSVTDTTAAPVTKDAITFTVTFDDAVVGSVGTSSFTATNGVVSDVTSAGSNAYIVVVTPTAEVSSGNVGLSLVGTGLTDVAGNTVVSVDLSSKDS